MMDDDDQEGDDLYGDLDEIQKSAQVVRLTEKVAELTKNNETLTTELLETKQQLELLVNEKAVVERNMMLLYNTAQREIERKDKQIVDLLATASSSSTNKRANTTSTTVMGGRFHSTATPIPYLQPSPPVNPGSSSTDHSGSFYHNTDTTAPRPPPPRPPPQVYDATNYSAYLQPPPPS